MPYIDFTNNRAVNVATIGDSTATYINPGSQSADGGTTWNCDTSVFAINAFPGSGATSAILGFEKFTLPLFYPRARPVYCAGITGQTATQILARDLAGASVTRAATTDAINSTPDAVIVRAGPINDISALTAAGSSQTNILAIYALHKQIIQRALASNAVVFDEGLQGWKLSTDAVTADIKFQRDALLQLNKMYKADYQSGIYGPNYIFVDLAGVTYDPFTGSYLPLHSADGTHLNWLGSLVLGKHEVKYFTVVFGASSPRTYDGVNLATNPLFANVTAGVPAGLTWTNASATIANAAVVNRNGANYAVIEGTATAPNGTVGFNLDNSIYTGGGIVVAANDQIGYEFDLFIESLSGGPPPTPSAGPLFRVDLNNGTGRFIPTPYSLGSPNISIVREAQYWHVAWNPVVMPAASAGMTSATKWLLNWQFANTGDAARFGVANVGLRKLPTAFGTPH